MSEEALARPRGLPFLKLATQGPGALFRNFFPFLQMAAIPILLDAVAWVASSTVDRQLLAPFVVFALDRVTSTLFGMAWLEYLLRPEAGRRYWLPRWSRAHWLFLLYGLAIAALQVLQGVAIGAMRMEWSSLFWNWKYPVLILLDLPVDYVHAAMGLAFCALAVKRPGGPLWSWRLMGWSAVKIMVIMVVASYSLAFAGTFIGGFVGSLSAVLGAPRLLVSLPGTIASYAAYAVALGTFAVAFRELSGWRGPQQDILERFE